MGKRVLLKGVKGVKNAKPASVHCDERFEIGRTRLHGALLFTKPVNAKRAVCVKLLRAPRRARSYTMPV